MPLSRRCLVCVLILLAAASASAPANAAVDIIFQDGFQIRYGFQVQSPDIVVPAGESAQLCYFFRTPNIGSLGIRRWLSTAAAGMHHVILYTTSIERQPAGTLTQNSCGIGAGADFPGWLYAAHDLNEDLMFPANDGSGNPLAVEVAAGQFAILEMYAINPTDQPITTSVLLKAEALDPSIIYSKSAAYLTEKSSIFIPPSASGAQEQGTCALPTAVKFWWLSTRTHRFATQSKIQDGNSDVLVTTDWEHPTISIFPTPPFYTFLSNALSYVCTYDNPTGSAVTAGDSETTDESCIGIGFFFPAPTGHKTCVNNIGPL